MATHEHEPGEMLTAAELADELKVSRRTLARWRSEGTGPPFVRAGRSPRYRWGDVQAWLKANADQGHQSGGASDRSTSGS